MIKHIYIFDIDGVLVDSSHRYRLRKDVERIDLDHWLKHCTAEHIFKDTLLPLAGLYKQLLENSECYVILATARQCIKADFDFIAEKLGMPQHFIYRKMGDTQSGTTLKLKGLRKLLNLKQFKNSAITFFEDNLDYLHGVADEIGANKVYIPSKQGY